LAAKEAKSSDDPKKSSEGILGKLKQDNSLKEEEYREGLTKVNAWTVFLIPNMYWLICVYVIWFSQVFFKAGILARLEEIRDEKLSAILTGLQAHIRSYIAKAETKRRYEQKYDD